VRQSQFLDLKMQLGDVATVRYTVVAIIRSKVAMRDINKI